MYNNYLPVLTVAGENAFQTIVSQMFVAMKREIPDPRPYPENKRKVMMLLLELNLYL